jgi:hypothetical protein
MLEALKYAAGCTGLAVGTIAVLTFICVLIDIIIRRHKK